MLHSFASHRVETCYPEVYMALKRSPWTME